MENRLADDLDALMQETGDLWESYRGARIFLTGGTGFFGRWLLESFLWANARKALGASLVVLSRNPEAFRQKAPHLAANPALSFHPGDVRHFTAPEGAFTHIIHAATDSCGGQRAYDELYLLDTIVTGTRNLLEFARQTGAARMLYVSSGAVYGRNRPLTTPITEDDPSAPSLSDRYIAYDESKRMAEALCSLYQREFGVPVTIARGFAFVGPYLPLGEHFAIGNFIGNALRGETIAVGGDGTAVRSYLYTRDLARWLWTMLAHGAPARAYNLGAGEAITIAELARMVQRVVNPSVAVTIAGTPIPGARVNSQVPDVTRARTELGLVPTLSLEEAIRRTADWHQHMLNHET